jgi:hypothetical protein
MELLFGIIGNRGGDIVEKAIYFLYLIFFSHHLLYGKYYKAIEKVFI